MVAGFAEDDLAVLPERRGNGYINEVLAEGTRTLAAQDGST